MTGRGCATMAFPVLRCECGHHLLCDSYDHAGDPCATCIEDPERPHDCPLGVSDWSGLEWK